MKTSIIILTHNKIEYTIQCIESIRLYTEPGSYEIIVVDNASTDETKNWLKQQEDLICIMNSENTGFPAGCNQGIQIATGTEVLLLNNDTVVTRNWLENLKEALYSDSTIGAVSCVTNNSSYGQAIETSYDSMSSMHDFAESINCSSPVELEERLKLVGFCMLIKSEVIDKVGLLDEQFSPGNYEDDDYSLRIRLAGYKLLLSRNTFIHHYGSVSFGEKLRKYAELLNTNSLKFEKKWGFNPNYSQHIRSEIVDLIREDSSSNLRILEVGCACGGTLLNIKHHYKNAEIFGLELNPESAKIASLIADVRAADIQTGELPYELEYFDFIIFADVLEHLSDPWSTIKNIKKYLRPTGRVLASIPNIMHHSVMFGLLKNGSWTYEDSGILDRTHLRFFTYESIQRLFKDSGFSKVSIGGKTLRESPESRALIETLSSFSNGQLSNSLIFTNI
ncbi:bifunctional glycosyltransferase family 2 protein/class I SAM-dependent methyltransferase [Paenibacillus sp. Marseille-Q4541]|uniref:bifunctional glycosyltransferase family 2 protein/class I SAM-dependent methyltransferase n=1 Tax=Paenibacillus sp. Marseille-Q4541 TaxID=2831522 RepID=UPI002019CA06|nr:bifunctional glycosyltransferase family 2 protein/class I SAM-dependent methyltransferase [Paenibacillus sp. Marseille-Q4541]